MHPSVCLSAVARTGALALLAGIGLVPAGLRAEPVAGTCLAAVSEAAALRKVSAGGPGDSHLVLAIEACSLARINRLAAQRSHDLALDALADITQTYTGRSITFIEADIDALVYEAPNYGMSSEVLAEELAAARRHEEDLAAAHAAEEATADRLSAARADEARAAEVVARLRDAD
ncbi:hypothetical protein [Frigidibacter sp. MR17.24]|uniref:hypothetical protein n=1 Tax=Frigidibacter sp. MR17.24 TaxID=3127345 RepID=UPI003012A12E